MIVLSSLPVKGFLGTGATFEADLNLVVQLVMGAALLTLPLDGFILLYRLVGLSRPIAVYAGLLTFMILGSLLAQRYFCPRKSNSSGEDNNA